MSDTLALVLTKHLDLSKAPESVRFLLSRCLERDPQKRLRDIGDAAILIDSTMAAAPLAGPAASKRIPIVLGFVALLGMLAATTLAVLHFNERHESPRAVQFQINTEGIVGDDSLTVSPDGRYLTFEEQDPATGANRLRIRPLDSRQARTLLNDFEARGVTWSPDSRFVAFVSGGKLQRVSVDGGLPETLVDAGTATGVPFLLRERWLYGNRQNDLMQVPASGGAPTVFIRGDQFRQLGLRGLKAIRFLPDDDHFLFAATDSSIGGTTFGIFGGSGKTIETLAAHGKPAPLLLTDSPSFSFARTADERGGYIFFSRDRALVAQAFDDKKLQVSGDHRHGR